MIKRQNSVHNNSWIKTLYLIGVILTLYSCNEIFEENISSKSVLPYSPQHNAKTIYQNIRFWWQTIDGATGYTIQIVSPSFDSGAVLIVNKNVTADTFNTSLPPGQYQWRITAFNSVSSTTSKAFSFTIIPDSSLDLRQQVLVLQSPNNEYWSNNKSNTFAWDKLAAANEYRVQIALNDFSTAANIKFDKRIITTTLTTDLEEGVYRWRVRGENDKSNTDYTERVLTIDLTPPSPPELLGPTNDSLASVPVLLRWSADINNSINDTVYIYQDSLLGNLVQKKFTLNTSYSFKDTTSSSLYYWRVRSVDKAGNVSPYSAFRRFKVKK